MADQLELPDDRPIPRSDAVVGLSVLGLLAAILCGSLIYRITAPSPIPGTLPSPTVVVSPQLSVPLSEESLANSAEQPSTQSADRVDAETLFQQDSEVAPANYLEIDSQ